MHTPCLCFFWPRPIDNIIPFWQDSDPLPLAFAAEATANKTLQHLMPPTIRLQVENVRGLSLSQDGATTRLIPPGKQQSRKGAGVVRIDLSVSHHHHEDLACYSTRNILLQPKNK